MRIGVDVGGTNTDAVLLEESAVRAATKTPTTADVSSGIVLAVREVLGRSRTAPAAIDAVMIGTTQFTNALIERRRLIEVAVIRICLPSNLSVRPMLDWPADLVAMVSTNVYLVGGGYELDGSVIAPLDEAAVEKAALDLRRKGLRHVAISCVFSPIDDAMERRAAQIVQRVLPDTHITLSSEIGRMGMLERENAAILNAALADLSSRVVGSFRAALSNLGIAAPFYISQNDGTLMAAHFAERYPVLTIASGPTNSMRGAGQLSGLSDAIVADIGGTTTDVGVLNRGFPRESTVAMEIGGVRTNFRMPDVASIGLGGGSRVRVSDGRVRIGPDSVGYELTERALVFGGDELTATDIAVAAGCANLGERDRVGQLSPQLVTAALDEMHRLIEEVIDRMKTNADPVPVVLVGGGGVLVSRALRGASQVVVPEHAGVANALGAAMAQVSGEIDRIFCYASVGRDRAIEIAATEARRKAIDAGADAESLEIVDVEEVPVAYMSGGGTRLRLKVVGSLAVQSGASCRAEERTLCN